MAKYKLINKYGEAIYTSNNIDILNKRLIEMDTVKWCDYEGNKEIKQGYNHNIIVNHKKELLKW